jgi:hypothetical protein
MRWTFPWFAAFAVLPGHAGAQNTTVPALLNGVEGGSGSSIPFGSNQPCRYQSLYDAVELPWSGPRLLSGLRLRADNPAPGTTTFPQKQFVFLSVVLSTTARRADQAATEFDQNHGTDESLVLQNVPLVLPAQPVLAGPRPANIVLTFAQPWFYGLTPSRTGGGPPPSTLVVELQIHSQPAGAYRVDGPGDCASPVGTFGQLGPQCQAGGQQLALVPGPSLLAGAAFTWTVQRAPPNTPFFVLVAPTATGTILGQPIPMPLFDPALPSNPNPALAALLPFSAPDCWLNVAPVASVTGLTGPGGSGSVSVATAAGRYLVGTWFYAQAAAYSQAANTLQYVTSLGQQVQACGPLGTARLYAFHANGTAMPAQGQLQLGQGLVFEVF